jgi:hypothetical protein
MKSLAAVSAAISCTISACSSTGLGAVELEEQRGLLAAA